MQQDQPTASATPAPTLALGSAGSQDLRQSCLVSVPGLPSFQLCVAYTAATGWKVESLQTIQPTPNTT